MGHGEEKWPEDRIVELAEELAQAQSRIAFFEHSQAVGQHPPLPPKPPAQPMIHAAMIQAMREVDAVGKDGRNTQQNYNFRGIDGVLNALGPALRNAGIYVTSELVKIDYRDTLTTGEKKTRECTVRVRYTFHAEDGSSVTTEAPGEALDQSDKGAPKAMSVAFRTALIQTYALPTQEPTTDDNGQYHTRSGTPTLSGWTASYGRAMIDHGDMEEVIDFWPAVVESSSIEAPSGYADNSTWGEGFAKRVAEFVAEEQSPEVLRALWGQLKAADMIGLFYVGNVGDQITRTTLGDLVVERGKQAKLNRDKAFDHCMALVLAAEDFTAMDAAMVHVKADLDEGPLSQAQYEQLNTVALERHNKIVAARIGEQNAEIARDETPPEFLPPVGEAWDRFVAAAGAASLDVDQLDGLLTGEGDTTPACEFGMNGVQRFIDAVKRSHQRDHTVDATQRAELFAGLRSYAHSAGIEIPNGSM